MKSFAAKVISIKQNKTAVVEVVRTVPHPLYGKLLTRTKRYQVDTAGFSPKEADEVIIVETRPISKNKNFKIKEIKKSINKDL